MRARFGGLVRLTHPFPSLLDGLVVGAVATVAGGDLATSIRLAVAMVGLQASIGALNDVVDAPHDAVSKPGKPIPSDLVSPDAARWVVVGGAGIGLLLSIGSGPTQVVLAGIVLAIGYAYDLWFKGTPWSWLPFAVGIPLLPVFGWVGAAATIPASFDVLLPSAVVAGAALAISNSRADAERDTAAGIRSVATALGPSRAWAIQAMLLAIVIVTALATLALSGATVLTLAAALVACGVVIAGVALGRAGDAGRRQVAWELEAIGLGLLAAVWLAGLPGGG